MKSVLLALFMIFMFMGVISAENESVSKTEKFSAKSGTLIEKSFKKVGMYKDVWFKIILYKDLMTNEKISAVVVETINKKGSDKFSTILDNDEIEGIIKSLNHIINNVFPNKPSDDYTEIKYKSRNGLEAGCYSKKDKWGAYIQVDKHYSDSILFLEQEDFTNILELLNKAKGML